MAAWVKRIAFCGLRRLNPQIWPDYEFGGNNDFLWDWPDVEDWYDFSRVNIFTGENGAGKSTIIELIDSLRDPSRLSSLPRENRIRRSASLFAIDFDSEYRLRGEAGPMRHMVCEDACNLDGNDANAQATDLRGISLDERGRPCRKEFHVRRNIYKPEMDVHSCALLKDYFSIFGCNVCWWSPDLTFDLKDFANALNSAGVHLTGLISSREGHPEDEEPDDPSYLKKRRQPFLVDGDGNLGVWLGDDAIQWNNVSIALLPSGWRQLASILCWLQECPKGSVCLIEEPETHLHPHLQRHLVDAMCSISDQQKLQLFITTHSPVVQNASNWTCHGNDIRLFEATGDKLEPGINSRRLLDALGIRGADISQSNGVIWVEGPSDRIYIKHWISLWCRANNLTTPKEHVDYSFMFYSGALLSHVSMSESDEMASLLRLNRNFILVMDKDLDFAISDDGTLHPLNESSPKARILCELSDIFNCSENFWVTDGYCIESYLPQHFREPHFSLSECGKLTHTSSRSKVAIARDFALTFPDYQACTDNPSLLSSHIEKVVALINKWNHH